MKSSRYLGFHASGLLLQAHPGGEGVHRAAGGGDREPRGQRQPGGPQPGPDAPPRRLHHRLRHRLLAGLLLPTQRTLHPQTGPAEPRPGHGAHGGHDAGISPRQCRFLHFLLNNYKRFL